MDKSSGSKVFCLFFIFFFFFVKPVVTQVTHDI